MKAIFFNAKGVLYSRPDPHHFLRAFLESNGLVTPTAEVLKKIAPALRSQTLRGRMIPEVYSDAVLKACGVTNPALYLAGEKAIERDHANIILLPGVIETVHELKKRGFKLGIITDSSAPREQKIGWMQARGLDIEWDAYSNSRDLQALKPDLSMYQNAMQQAGVRAAESAFVGRHAVELSGAKLSGMTTLAVFCDTAVTADLHLQNFEDLLTLPLFAQVS